MKLHIRCTFALGWPKIELKRMMKKNGMEKFIKYILSVVDIFSHTGWWVKFTRIMVMVNHLSPVNV